MTTNWAEAAQGIGAIMSVIVSIIGFWFVYRQIRQTQKAIEQSNHTSIYGISNDFYIFLAENSELRPFFYEGKEFDLNNELSNKILIACEMLVDIFEYTIIENKSINPSIYKTWKSYIEIIYINSPALRYYLGIYRPSYSSELLSIFDAIELPQNKNLQDGHTG